MQSYKEFIKEARASVEYWAEVTIDDFVRAVSDALHEKGMSRSDLAQEIGKSRGYVSKVLSGTENLTIKTMNTIASGLELAVRVNLEPRTGSGAKSLVCDQAVSHFDGILVEAPKGFGVLEPTWRIG